MVSAGVKGDHFHELLVMWRLFRMVPIRTARSKRL